MAVGGISYILYPVFVVIILWGYGQIPGSQIHIARYVTAALIYINCHLNFDSVCFESGMTQEPLNSVKRFTTALSLQFLNQTYS